jgi:AcrR family transcriptional regulator
MDEIAEDAGVSKPMIYAYLGTKDNLFTAHCSGDNARTRTLSIAYALVGAVEALSDWALEHPEETPEALTTRLMDIFWTGLQRSRGL